MLEKLGGRKFLLALIVLAVGVVVQLKSDRGVTEAFTALMLGLVATFSASNAYVTARMSSEGEAAPAPTVDLQPTLAALSSLQGQVGEIAAATQAHAASLQVLHEGVSTAQKLARAAVSISG